MTSWAWSAQHGGGRPERLVRRLGRTASPGITFEELEAWQNLRGIYDADSGGSRKR